ncbi:MAG: YbhN family protein [Candidatus Nanopelagicales bacterium]
MTDSAPAVATAAKRPSKARLVVMIVLGLAVMVGIFALLLPQASSYEEALEELKDFPAGWLVALVAAGVLNIGLYPLTVLVAVPGLGYWHGFVERQGGFVVSNVVPGGGAIAVGTQYGILARYGVGPSLAAAAVSADAIWTYLLTLGSPAVAVLLLVIEGRSAAAYTTTAVVGMLIVIVSVVAIAAILRSDGGARWVGRFAERLVAPVLRRLHRHVPDLPEALVAFRLRAHDLVAARWPALTVTNAVAQLTPFLVLVCALAGLGAIPDQVSLIETFAAYSIALILTSFPITPGGLGTVDAALVGLLSAFGAPGSVAVAADLVWRLVWFLPQLLVGAVALGVYALERRRHPQPASSP